MSWALQGSAGSASVSDVFDDLYASTYDLVYQSKDYEREVAAVQRIVEQYGSSPIHTILDLGCGTGQHAVLLTQRGFAVTGIDRSEQMLSRARQRAARLGLAEKVEFRQADIRNFDFGRSYDAALMMFNVLGYMTTNDDLLAALAAVRRHLRSDGLLAFDIWYGPAVVADPPRDGLKEFSTPNGTVTRYTSGRLHAHEQRCDIAIRLYVTEDGKVSAESKELHAVRYFFPMELDIALRMTGFHLLAVRRFPDIDNEPSTTAWGAIVVAATSGGADACSFNHSDNRR
jgi:SAM-dependent methyltransferase